MLPQALSEVPGDECGVRHCSLAKPFAYLDPLHRQTDWTDGCIAVTNAEIEEIWKLVPVGTRVEIPPVAFSISFKDFFLRQADSLNSDSVAPHNQMRREFEDRYFPCF
jgi:hypothetical protein